MQSENYQLQTDMDIVNRLMTFMESYGIGSTQFADACGIPRPTLSQILSGRNKKISDAVIAKIHNAYPNLSVLWLLFGEGAMESPAVVRSQPQKPESHAQSIPAPSQGRNAFVSEQTDDSDEIGGLFSGDSLFFGDEDGDKETAKNAASGAEEPVVTIPADDSKSIVNIMVFYSDNSYQSFVPR